jgi:ABC-type transport system involved in cytochrome c biogenesis permease subunit
MTPPSATLGRQLAAACAIAGLLALFGSLVVTSMPKGKPRQIDGYQPWSKETLAVAATLPIQDGGRIKPLATYAGFSMLASHGSRAMKVAGGDGKAVKLTPTAWLLDTLFRPQFAVHHPTFRIDNSAVLEAIGVKAAHKRDRYSYQDITPGLEKLWELAGAYEPLPPKSRQPLQQQVLDFAYTVRDYERLLGQLTFARNGVQISNEAGQEPLAIGAVLEMAPKIREDLTKARQAGEESTGPARYLYDETYNVARLAMQGLSIFPPAAAANSTWESPGVVIMNVLNGEVTPAAPGIQDIRALERICRAIATSETEFLKELTALRADLNHRAASRGEGRHVAMEAGYYRLDWFLNAFVVFFIGGLCAMAMWLAGAGRAGRILARVTLGWTLIGLTLCVIAITQRCLIMQRAPVGNLYDTIIFISAAMVLLALVLEWFFRRRFALGAAPIMGAVLVYLSRRFEMGDPKDHMDPLVAVLASNFWLTLHVITITLGYAAGLLAAFLSTIYILMRGLRLDNGDSELRSLLTRATYGIVCVTLFLSLVGTVLGGIWANDSWGRFWGWDPKENGALLIVIWTLVILHARAGGLLREWGVHLATAFTACVIVFSWWHVNFLGVGLHNYGFTAGQEVVWTFYTAMLIIIVFGAVARRLERRA